VTFMRFRCEARRVRQNGCCPPWRDHIGHTSGVGEQMAKVPPWTACEFEKLLDSFASPPRVAKTQLYLGAAMTRLQLSRMPYVRFHRGELVFEHGLLSRMSLWILIERPVVSTCPQCGAKFRGTEVGKSVAEQLCRRWIT
jgi:hypothetical protein